ncbi:EAL domain-containing protein [Acaryochloris sp. IP29b_bin.137]|uniref:EAL domain-containing protein n=1 Tax=Acaryochloris sp. IP29b_bin.137 TaxID=2969217 RepID=UPI0026119EAC|nr:EAL domain-containing protein [Acaryochloris sp. IP29b_bin.137]
MQDTTQISLDVIPGDITSPTLRETRSRPPQPSHAGSGSLTKAISRAHHLLVIKEGGQQQTVVLEAATYSIGRHPANSIVLNVGTVSRQHALLLRIHEPKTGNHFFRVIDGNIQGRRSRNGLWINGKRRFSHDLKDQEIISFGEDIQATYHLVTGFPGEYELDDLLALNPAKSTTPPTFTPQPLPSDTELHNLGEAALVRLSSFPELMPHPIIETDFSGSITYINPAAVSQFPDILESSQHPLLQGFLAEVKNAQNTYFVREVHVCDRVFEQSIHCMPESQVIRSYLVDITQRKRAEQILRESEERYAAAARGANDGLWDWHLRSNRVYFSPRWKSMIGYEEDEISDHCEEWLDRIHPDDRDRLRQELSLHLQGETAHFQSEFRLRHKNGKYRWFRSRGMALRDPGHQPYRIAGSQTDITEYYLAREQLVYDALHDALTRLPNRVLFMDRLTQAIKQHHRHPDDQFAILFLDLDRFKIINDSLGHMIGDRLLIEVGHRLQSCLREEDTVARLGGDEFVILLNTIQSMDHVLQTAERIQQQLKQAFAIEGHEIFTGTSIGIALSSAEYQHAEELLRDADTAMYRAKNLGKNRYEIFSSSMRSQVLALSQLENDLRRAIDREEFQLFYQPIVSLDNQDLVGVEALVRWHHPERGLILPSEFVPMAEEAGLIIPLGWWVLAQACRQMQVWQRHYSWAEDLQLNVNISSRQFSQPNFVNDIHAVLDEANLPCHRLKLEITEGVLMDHASDVADKLEAIKTLGIRLGIDDFGTGYSSLNYLNAFPVDTLKIDRSFVERMNSEEGFEIVKTIVNLAHNLHMDVVAEGVELAEQAEELTQMNCEYAQGYLFAKPTNREGMEQFLLGYYD